MKTILLKIITPTGVVFNSNSTLVTIKTISGYRGILPNHAPLVSFLDIGIMNIHLENNKIIHYNVSNGLLIVKPNIVKILTDSISKVNKND